MSDLEGAIIERGDEWHNGDGKRGGKCLQIPFVEQLPVLEAVEDNRRGNYAVIGQADVTVSLGNLIGAKVLAVDIEIVPGIDASPVGLAPPGLRNPCFKLRVGWSLFPQVPQGRFAVELEDLRYPQIETRTEVGILLVEESRGAGDRLPPETRKLADTERAAAEAADKGVLSKKSAHIFKSLFSSGLTIIVR